MWISLELCNHSVILKDGDWFGTDWSHTHENQVVLVMSSFGTSNYDITFDRINVELIPYVQALIGIDFEHSVYDLRLVSKGKL